MLGKCVECSYDIVHVLAKYTALPRPMLTIYISIHTVNTGPYGGAACLVYSWDDMQPHVDYSSLDEHIEYSCESQFTYRSHCSVAKAVEGIAQYPCFNNGLRANCYFVFEAHTFDAEAIEEVGCAVCGHLTLLADTIPMRFKSIC